ncbi:MAG TPA: homoserine O-succinyltransferase [Stellaceae bacterium]|nr:homoserine O-succinyltransferase [Stellaceae bacterium]
MARLGLDRLWRKPAATGGAGPVTIGLVNNMPDTALKSTERQFRDLLASATGTAAVRLRIFSLPDVPRSAEGQAYVAEHHEPTENLWAGDLDGLIVTGNAPRAPQLEDEPYWPALARLVDWADEHTISTVWSCLAAHAAVHRLDGIGRQPFDGKLSGVFDCVKTANHPLVGFGPDAWRTPHSRYNDLPEQALAANGYCILARSDAGGADLFIKQRQSLFVFLQGHPEYDAGALLREYRRDVCRFLAGQSEAYPVLPLGYFKDAAEAAMLAFAERAHAARGPALMTEFPCPDPAELTAPWQSAAIRLFANWLTYLADERARRLGPAVSGLPPVPRVLDPTYA